VSLRDAIARGAEDTHARPRRARDGTRHQPGSDLADRISAGHVFTESGLLQLQRTVGNQAVMRMLAVQRLGRSRGAPQAAQLEPGKLPTVASIAAHASGVGPGSFGDHATVFLAVSTGDPAKPMEYHFIDLVLDQDSDRKGAVRIRIVPMKGSSSWPGPDTSTTWELTDAQARAALAKAQEFQANQAKYKYNVLGIGWRRYNCALFVEKILEAGGVKRSAGVIFSTPLEVATGKKVPERRQRGAGAEAEPAAPAIPAQYDI
jgi:hypothetical protein